MRIFTLITIASLMLVSGCALSGKRLRDNKSGVEGTSISKTLAPATPIKGKEVEEKLVPVESKTPDPYHYFVIIGSFRNPENAKKHQSLVGADGFKSEVLKNDAGLYRVSVMGTDDLIVAREEIGRIRDQFPEYSDTWLLIQKF